MCPPGFGGTDCARSTANQLPPPAQCGAYSAYLRSIHEDLLPWAADGMTEAQMDAALTHTIQSTAHSEVGIGFLLRGGKLFVINGAPTDFELTEDGKLAKRGGMKWLMTYVHALARLAQTDGAQLADCEFVVEQGDHGDHGLDLSKPDNKAPLPWSERRRSAPLLRYCKSEDSPEILIPYHHIYERKLTAELLENNATELPWAQRQDVVFGNHHSYNRIADTPSTARVGADGQPLPEWIKGSTRAYLRNVSLWAGPEWVNSSSLEILTKSLPMHEWRQFKYLLHIDGITCTSKLEQMLPLGSLIMKEQSGYRSFFHRLLVPFEHYVPYWRHRPQELLDALAWARAHDAEAAAIGAASQALARKYLHKDGIRCYWVLLLTELARLQRGFTPGARLPPAALVPVEEYLGWARAADNGTGRFSMGELELV